MNQQPDTVPPLRLHLEYLARCKTCRRIYYTPLLARLEEAEQGPPWGLCHACYLPEDEE